MNPETAPIIEKWYKALNFDSKYDAQFYEALHTISIPVSTSIHTYAQDCRDGKKNLLAFLYMCEALQEVYEKRGISRQILLDSLHDIVIWCNTWSKIKGELYLGELHWIARTLRFGMFTLGRLQYCIETADAHMTQFGFTDGETYLSVHIPAGDPLNIDRCKESFAMAQAFFAEYFPDMQYTWYSCNSWLLDDTLQEYLPEDSNILKFAAMFRVVERTQADDIIRFIFGWDATRKDLSDRECRSRFAQRIKDAAAQGKVFYECRGLLRK